MNLNITNKGLYWALIITFGLLYVFVAFVSTLHAIDFFRLANTASLAILLGVAYEIGQSAVLFSILLTKNKEKFLPWALMILLTGLQITANVYASFKHIMLSGSSDWMFWQKSILFGVQASTPEMYQMIISWISGALLPVVALGMTALVAQNIQLMSEENNKDIEKDIEKDIDNDATNVFKPKESLLKKYSVENQFQEKEIKENVVNNDINNISLDNAWDNSPYDKDENDLWEEASLTDLQKWEDEEEKQKSHSISSSNEIISNNGKSIGVKGTSGHPDPVGIEEIIVTPLKKRGRPSKKDDAVIESKKV
jgi:hypothetical protein